ncbi:YegP family protein [Haloarchaeobius sp. HRN-SO-5]|uniref:YegP family protein n=1 Tax=Haloarchaeobius sp. HRN-SO-5 TaxID=3446118 RepID=UPI003EBD3974
MTHTFELYEDAAERYRWRLVASNGEIVADSGEGYATRSSAREAVSRIQDDAPDAVLPSFDDTHFEVFEDAAGQYRWRLVASNGRIIADSGEGYASKYGARDAARRVQGHVGDAETTEREDS